MILEKPVLTLNMIWRFLSSISIRMVRSLFITVMVFIVSVSQKILTFLLTIFQSGFQSCLALLPSGSSSFQSSSSSGSRMQNPREKHQFTDQSRKIWHQRVNQLRMMIGVFQCSNLSISMGLKVFLVEKKFKNKPEFVTLFYNLDGMEYVASMYGNVRLSVR